MEPQVPPTDPIAQYQCALSLHNSGRLAEAQALYQALLGQFPGNPLVLTGLGTIAMQQGDLVEGVRLLELSVGIEPEQPMAYSNLGLALRNLDRLEEALVSLDRAIALAPDFAEAYDSRGSILYDLGRLAEALVTYDQLIALKPDHAEAYNRRGVILKKIGQTDAALASYNQAVALKPDFAEAYSNQGNALTSLGRLSEALVGYDRAIALKPDFAEAHNNRGMALAVLVRCSEALASYDRAIALNPNYAEAHSNRGIVLSDFLRHDEALASYDRAIALNPDYAAAYWNKSLLKLVTGDFAEGWRLYEWRWKDAQKDSLRTFSQPLWLGEQPLSGKTVLIHPEQGLGDFIQFCRYVPMVEALGAKVVLEVPAPLVSLVSTMKGQFTIVQSGQPLPSFDLHCPIMSLPLAFGTTLATIPVNVPYLFADAAKQEVWRQRLGSKMRLRVGLVWSGNPAMGNDRKRSMPFRLLEPLLGLPLEFHALQKDIRPDDAAVLAEFSQVRLHQAELHDFSDTAALLQEMDLVISVCTSVAHLAGAMGKPVWILLHFGADYRWMLERSDSPWYPTAALFRQPALGDWPSVVAEVTARLWGMAREADG